MPRRLLGENVTMGRVVELYTRETAMEWPSVKQVQALPRPTIIKEGFRMEFNPKKSKQTGKSFLDSLKFKRGDSPEFRFTVLRDTREQIPWEFPDFQVRDEKLDVGDYSIGFKFEGRIRKMDRLFVVERKGSASEMCAMVGQERDRWQRELAKLKRIQHAFIIAECSLQDFIGEVMVSGINPTSAFGSVVAWQKYFPLIWAGNRTLAREHFLVLARLFWKKYVLGHRRGHLEDVEDGS